MNGFLWRCAASTLYKYLWGQKLIACYSGTIPALTCVYLLSHTHTHTYTTHSIGFVSRCQPSCLTDQGAQIRPARTGAVSDQSEAKGRDQCQPDDRDPIQHESCHFLRRKGPQSHHGYTWLWKCMSAMVWKSSVNDLPYSHVIRHISHTVSNIYLNC